MLQRLLAYLIFAVLMTLSIAGSALVVVFLYLPFVALKAIYMTLGGKAKLRALQDADNESSEQRSAPGQSSG